jgi:hypothetical protein
MATNNRNRTVRRSTHDLSANAFDFSANEPLQKMIEQEAGGAFKKPWHRLERGLRMNRIRLFVQDLSQKRGFKESEKQSLLSLLMKSLDKKLLNSKTSVEYDTNEECIKEIKPLVMHQAANGDVLFHLLEKRNAVTFRKRAPATEFVEVATAPASALTTAEADT